MRKSLLILISILIIIVSIAIVINNNTQNNEKQLIQFNNKFSEYLENSFLGTDVATLIGKAVDNNEKNNILKNDKGLYILDNEYSIKVYVKFLDNDTLYDMEKIDDVGISQFVSNFNTSKFECIKVNYHNNKRISEIYISEIEKHDI